MILQKLGYKEIDQENEKDIEEIIRKNIKFWKRDLSRLPSGTLDKI